jgi:hypothetical protein
VYNVNGTLTTEYPFIYRYYSGGTFATSVNATAHTPAISSASTAYLYYLLSVESSAHPGVFRMNLTLTYRNSGGTTQTTLRRIDVPLAGYGSLRVQRVVITPSKVYPGDQGNNLKVYIINDGTTVARNVEVTITLKPPLNTSWAGSDRVYLGSLTSGQALAADFYFDIDESASSPKAYSVPLTVKYGADQAKTEEDTVIVYVSGKASFAIDGIDMPPTISSGDMGVTVKVSLRNLGNVTANSVRAELRGSNVFSGTMSDYLASVSSSGRAQATFALDVADQARPDVYTLSLRVSWTQDNTQFSQTLTLPVRVQAKQPVALYVLAIAGLVAAVGVLVWLRGRTRAERIPPEPPRAPVR